MGAMSLTGFVSSETIYEAPETISEVSQITTVEDAKEFIQNMYPELEDVATCESRWIPEAKNPVGTASGIFQFLDSTAVWVYDQTYGGELNMENKNDLQVQVTMAVWLYEHYQLSHWQYPCGTLMVH